MNDHLQSFSKLEFDKVKKLIERYVVSELGREHIAQLYPSSSVEEIRKNLSAVSEMKQLLNAEDPLPLDTIPDIRTSLHHSSIAGYVLSSEELFAIAKVLEISQGIQRYFAKRKQSYPQLAQLIERISFSKILMYNIQQAIDEEGHVRDNASKELSGIRREMRNTAAVLRSTLERILKSVAEKDWAQEEIVTTREGRMVIPVKTEHKNRVKGFIHSSSSSGATVFIEPTETLDLNNEIRTLQFREQREIQRILSDLTLQVQELRETLFLNLQILGILDFIQAKAKFSIEVIGSEPRVSYDKIIRLHSIFHPLLLHHHKRQEIVPLTFEVQPPINTVIITGPNAGGKSVAMKTVALLTILAQSGCHIPAAPDSEVRVFSDIFVDMGDEQSIENDLSSFSSHLQNLKLIIDSSNDNSLVLIDEIGAGTDPVEGSALAAAILDSLSSIGCTTIVTTHQGSLKTLATERNSFQNASMEFDRQTLRPTYRYRAGVPGSSYAIEMAQKMNLPEGVINYAKELRGNISNKLEDLIVEFEDRIQELNKKIKEVQGKELIADSLRLQLDEKLKKFKDEQKILKAKAIEEAQMIVNKANTTIEGLVRSIRETEAGKKETGEAKRKIDEMKKEFENLKENDFSGEISSPIEFNVGDRVRLKGSSMEGEIVEKYDNAHYLIVSGGMKVNVHSNNIEQNLRRTGLFSQNKANALEFTIDAPARRDIDLRGLYGDEAINAIEKLFDDAIVHGIQQVSLIHGKGTGALRRKIKEYLEHHPAIKSFRLGEWNEGGSGVTVVDLK